MIRSELNLIFKKTSFVYMGGGPDSFPVQSVLEGAKAAPSTGKEGNVLNSLKAALKTAPKMQDLPPSVGSTIDGVRAEVQKVASVITQRLDTVESGEVSANIRNALRAGVRSQLADVAGDLRTDPSVSIERVRTVVEDLSKIVKADFKDGRVHVDEVFIRSMVDGKAYGMRYKDDGVEAGGALKVEGEANAEEKEGNVIINGPDGFRLEMRTGAVDKGFGAGFSVGHKNSRVETSASLDRDERGNLSGGGGIKVNVGEGNISTSYTRDAAGNDMVSFGLNQGGFGMRAVHVGDQSAFNLEYSGGGAYVRTQVGVVTSDDAGEKISPDAPVSAVGLEAGTSIPGGVVGVNVGQGGKTTSIGLTASFYLVGDSPEAAERSKGPAGPSVTLGTALGTDVSVESRSVAGTAHLTMEGRF